MKYFYVNNIKINYIPDNRSIIDYCENLGINIPHYCYHPNLSIAGNCRMCLVEVEKSPKPVVSCAMSLLHEMEIYTDSPLVKKAREGVLEFLLINHPLDCPVCDQGGECDLQDQSFVFGINKKRFYNYKRVVLNKNIGPIVKTVMTRCIHCTRCVRFATEIAGIEDLGVFGRGVNSEIGTYVSKIFNSELSGNVIDICPVGALTSKQYPFVSRIWELKCTKSIDYSDSSLINTQVYTKSNMITKILPGSNVNNNLVNWISDKTRFSFDGMFSPNRIIDITIEDGSSFTIDSNINSWVYIFNEIKYLLYFKYHLTMHNLSDFKLHLVFNYNLDLESLNLLLLLSKKYSFIHLRILENSQKLLDLEPSYLLNTFKNNFYKTDLCLLLNTYSRYENYNVNLKLRQKFLQGGLDLFSISSSLNYTFPVKNLGSNIKIFKKILAGNHFLCQNFIRSTNPTILSGANSLNRKDSTFFLTFSKGLTKLTSILTEKWNGLNILNYSINETGAKMLKSFKSLSPKDIEDTSGLVFINSDLSSVRVQKIIDFKLLGFLNTENLNNKFILDINNLSTVKHLNTLKSMLKCYTYMSLPNKVFLENSGLYLNNSGNYSKTMKVIKPQNFLSKDTWQILRKFNTCLDSVFCNNISLYEDFISPSILNKKNDIIYLGLQYFPNISLYNNVFYKTYVANNTFIHTFKNKFKFFETKFILWIEDFYIGGTDLYSKFSMIMIECSRSFRKQAITFKYII
ncbi:MAG: NADH-quinone oxidoreductase subunit NuoG [Pelagibacterales bacterium]|nr:NADH-quinone oxidoreductase subunit NuoG [Pelagibacterales bacterium]